MAVRKTSGGLWVADVTLGKRLDGTRDRRQPTFKTKVAAVKEERRLNALKETKRGKSYGGITFQEFVEDYFWPQKTNLRGTTIKGYKRDLKLRLHPAFHDMAMEDIDRYAIQKMISSCATKKIATNARETLSSILKLAVEMGVIPINPASFTYSYPPATRVNQDAYGVWLTTLKACRRVIEWAHETLRGTPEERMIVLGLGFGLRKGEVLGLDAEHVHVPERLIRIEQSWTEGEHGPELTDPKTPKARRSVPMTSLCAEIIDT